MPARMVPTPSKRFVFAALVLAVVALSLGCKELDGRNGNRRGNRYFREMQFIDAAAEYERALKLIDEPIVHYNLGLAYSKMYRPGLDGPVLLGETSDSVCRDIPGVKTVDAEVCIKKASDDQDLEGRRRFASCSDKDVCPSSYTCKKAQMCAADSPALADLAAQHLNAWIKAQPPDEELKRELVKMRAALEVADAANRKQEVAALEKRIEELSAKDDMRKLMTQVWLDTQQYDKAIAYWESELVAKPKDPTVMGNLAGINLKSGNWRRSIEWYLEVAEVAPDDSNKIAAYQFIGNVAWSKLNSKTLSPAESIELADRGIGALQKAAALAPKLAKLVGLQASLYNFRSLAHGASWAAAIDRASAQDLQKASRVLAEEAKKAAQDGQASPSPTAEKPSTPGG